MVMMIMMMKTSSHNLAYFHLRFSGSCPIFKELLMSKIEYFIITNESYLQVGWNLFCAHPLHTVG